MTTMSQDVLHYFMCRMCSNVMVVTVKVRDYERCNGCTSWMKYMWTVPVETDEQRALHKRGKVWNPHKVQPKKCDVCGRNIYELFGDSFIPGVGQFCKDTRLRQCTTEGQRRHEAAMSRTHA